MLRTWQKIGLTDSSQALAGKQMERIRPIRYRVNWDNIPVDLLLSKMEVFKLTLEDVMSSNPWCTPEQFEAWKKSEGTLGMDNPDTYSRIVRLPKQKTNWPELNKIFDTFHYGTMDYISFVELPKGTGYPPHRDIHRSCNINFIRPSTDGTPVVPLVIGDTVYNYDRFVFDPKPMHYVPAVNTTRFTIMLTWKNTSYEEVLDNLERDGWV